MSKCKHYNPTFDVLKKLCETLYSLPECGVGGNLHILLDDNNFDDDSILFCMKECATNPEHPSSSIGMLICHEYLKMSMEERVIFDWYWCGNDLKCYGNCDECRLMSEDTWRG